MDLSAYRKVKENDYIFVKGDNENPRIAQVKHVFGENRANVVWYLR